MDARKSLPMLAQEWSTCVACQLGERRLKVGGHYVAGEGVPGRIMFIGEGPGKDEEKSGRPFVGKSGELLRKILHKLGIYSEAYITNCVTCRSCTHAVDGEGQLKYWNDGSPAIVDEAPSPPQLAACAPRLYEEIYIVDPILIVTLGNVASSHLAGAPVPVTQESGKARAIKIPGLGSVPSLTDKKKVWARVVKKQLSLPTMPNMVEYLCVPCLHPAYVLRLLADQSPGSPLETFVETMKLVRDIYYTYQQEVLGVEFARNTAEQESQLIQELSYDD